METYFSPSKPTSTFITAFPIALFGSLTAPATPLPTATDVRRTDSATCLQSQVDAG